MSHLEHAFGLAGLQISIGGLLLFISAAITMKSLLMLLAMAQVGYSAAHAAKGLRLAFLRALLEARWPYFVDRRAGDLASAVGLEPERAASAYVAFCRALAGLIQLLIYGALCVAISWEVSVAALFVGVFGIAVLNRFVVMSRRAGRDQTELRKSFMTRLLQGLDGMKPLKAMAREGSLGPPIEADIHGLNRTQRALILSRESLFESHEVVRALAVAGGLYVFLTVWSQPVESLLVLVLLFARTLQRVSGVQSHYQACAQNQPAFSFVRATIAAAQQARESTLTGTVPRFASAIALRGVSFSYGRANVLDGVSLTLPSGAFIAVIGPSGAGKTTVADLVIGLLRPQHGEVWVDDLPMCNIDAGAWRRTIGYVPQGTFLFHDTVRSNVTLGDLSISDARVETALRRAEAWDFVAAMPEGVDSDVGERGTRLSGGQRQRIAIARALVRDPVLLILDEATTALDPEAETGIVATIRRLAGTVTVLSISHQPAMRRAADIVYRLDAGRAVRESTGDRPIAGVASTGGGTR